MTLVGRTVAALCFLMLSLPLATTASAGTAVFNSSVNGPNALTTAEVNAADGIGYGFVRREVVTIVTADLFATSPTDSLTIFQFRGQRGSGRAQITFGFMDTAGNILFQSATILTRATTGGNSVTINNAFQQGCAAFGGCNFFQITGARGYTLDAVAVNGTVLQVGATVAATPEPGSWAFLLLGFAFLAWRLKLRKQRLRLPGAAPARA